MDELILTGAQFSKIASVGFGLGWFLGFIGYAFNLGRRALRVPFSGGVIS